MVHGNPTPETIYNDLKFIPCPQPQPALGSHWVNGVEIFRHVFAYTPGSTKLYLGLRAEGFIGDGDGNGNPDNAGGGSCNPDDNIEDTFGISGNELYSWSFDLNCDGSTDGTIKVQDNAVSGTGTLAGATGTLAFRQGGIASGHDLELEITLPAPLPPAFRFVRVEANAFDGLSEDRSDGAVCVANPAIAVVKSAVPTTVCAGNNTRFSIEVSNTGQTPLSVVVVDQLPAQLSYAGGLSSGCGVGAPVVNGQVLTFPAFNLAAGANCTISFDAAASLQCFGSQNNIVDVTGTFTSACIAEGGAISKTAHAEFAVVCQSPPCVEVTASGPPAACPGAPVTIEGTAKNCSLDPELIVVTVNGAQAYSNTVAAGQTINWSLNTTMPAECTAGQNSSFAVVATGSSDCGTDTKNTHRARALQGQAVRRADRGSQSRLGLPRRRHHGLGHGQELLARPGDDRRHHQRPAGLQPGRRPRRDRAVQPGLHDAGLHRRRERRLRRPRHRHGRLPAGRERRGDGVGPVQEPAVRRADRGSQSRLGLPRRRGDDLGHGQELLDRRRDHRGHRQR